MRVANGKYSAVVGLITLVWICSFTVLPCFAQQDQGKTGNGPERSFTMYFDYPEIILPGGINKADLNLTFTNKGKRDETVHFDYQVPAGWQARAEGYGTNITALYIPAGEAKAVTFTISPEEKTKAGVYHFKVAARTEDSALRASRTLKVTLGAKAKEKEGEIVLTTSYPVLQGSSDGKFEFALSVNNKTKKELPFSLISDAPKGWRVNFKPPFKDTYISSVMLKPEESESVTVLVTPDPFAAAQEHTIPITVMGGDFKAEAFLKVIITGTYKVDVGTDTGLLSLSTQRGKPSNISIYVQNTGSAVLQDVSLLSVKPENWKVSFNPEKIASLEPGKLEQVEVTIVPGEESLVGDYAVGVSVDAEKASDNLELRVTAKASAAWGWIGVGIIILVIAGLFGLFRALGRR